MPETLDYCPVCAAAYSDEAANSYPDALFPGGFLHVHRCKVCGVTFLNPRLTTAEMLDVEERSDVYVMPADEAEREIVARVGLLGSLESYAPRRGAFLDIGCNRGLMLEAAKRRGWELVAGVEIAETAAAEARALAGVEVYPDLSNVVRPPRGFDLALAWHVLEHTSDPVAFLKNARAVLADDGVIAIQVPAFEHLDKWEHAGRRGSVVCAVHNFMFDAPTLELLLRRAELAIVSVSSSPDDWMLTAIGANRSERSAVGRLRHLLGGR